MGSAPFPLNKPFKKRKKNKEKYILFTPLLYFLAIFLQCQANARQWITEFFETHSTDEEKKATDPKVEYIHYFWKSLFLFQNKYVMEKLYNYHVTVVYCCLVSP